MDRSVSVFFNIDDALDHKHEGRLGALDHPLCCFLPDNPFQGMHFEFGEQRKATHRQGFPIALLFVESVGNLTIKVSVFR